MLSMYDNPDGLHRLMRFLCDDHLAFARWLEREGLLSLNNANDYIGSGSMGYSNALPQPELRRTTTDQPGKHPTEVVPVGEPGFDGDLVDAFVAQGEQLSGLAHPAL